MPDTTAKPKPPTTDAPHADSGTKDNMTASDKAAPLHKTDEFGATVETLVVIEPLEEEEDDTCYIEYRQPFTDEQGVQHVRVHRVPRDNWEKYSKKHGF